MSVFRNDSMTSLLCVRHGVRVVCADAPVITLPPDDFSVEHGQTISLECRASGSPQPVLTWSKNDLALPRDPRFNALARGQYQRQP